MLLEFNVNLLPNYAINNTFIVGFIARVFVVILQIINAVLGDGDNSTLCCIQRIPLQF